jgi:DNA-directed RNA polymerase sigma subunit (sigma70/sigma32)
MPQNLETLKSEIEAHLEQLQIAVFHGYHRMPDAMTQVSWDVQRQPDFRLFLMVARQIGAKLIIFHQQPFTMDQIDESLEQLEDCDFTRDEKRSYENRLRQLQAYEGFTCLQGGIRTVNAACKLAPSKTVSNANARRGELITKHMPLVRTIALAIRKSIPVHIDLDDLIHAGTMGLFDAATK